MGRYRGHRGRRDANHAEIRDGLRALGLRVADTADLADFVDLVVAHAKRNYLLEVKPPEWTKPRSQRERDQQEWREAWAAAGGQVDVVRSLDDALMVLGLRPAGADTPGE